MNRRRLSKRYGHFKYQVISFGLSNAAASFQGYITKILAETLDVFIIVYLDDILIYIEDKSQTYMEAVQWVLDLLQKNRLFAHLKNYRFYQNKVRFLGYVVSVQRVQREDERIGAIKNWPKPKSVRDIQVFLDFANFYWSFIHSSSKIAGPLTLMLQTNGSSKNLPSSMDVAKCDEIDTVGGDGDCKNETVKRSPSKNLNRAIGYLTPKARLAFTILRKAFTKAPILWHFDPECHIRIETNVSGYAISGVLS